ncbi:hypothetical protein BI372_14675 [Acinetobacter pittii]|nr:hypothetical protein BI372_14675 [Acinetobacter pittii]
MGIKKWIELKKLLFDPEGRTRISSYKFRAYKNLSFFKLKKFFFKYQTCLIKAKLSKNLSSYSK